MITRARLAMCGVVLLAACSSPTDHTEVTPPSCAFALSLSTGNVPAAGGSGTATVTSSSTSGASCSWNATASGGAWLSVSGTTTGTGAGTFGFAATTNPDQTSRSGMIALAWTGSTAGSTSRPVTQDAAAAATGVTASFTVKSTTGKADDNCEVTSGFKVRCTFDGTASTPAAPTTTYAYVIQETSEELGTQATLQEPSLRGCNVFNDADAGGTIKATVVLTVKAGSQTATLPKKVTFIKNGVC
ncbi:MAG TPA: hypothetical protein VG736_08325 [Vicinamibacterales bacterium]|jgi:hypothetical protein|nr:hypothetical protein [Vicinamibacterales bacterium]